MVWACFSWYGVGPIHLIEGIMTKEIYMNILQSIMLPHAKNNMPLVWTFQQDTDPKHVANTTKEWFTNNGVALLEWPAQSPDLNPIENLWKQVKDVVGTTNPKNKKEL